MTDRPILFSAPMVRALLAGTKTQTRRVLKPSRKQIAEWNPDLSICPSARIAGDTIAFDHPLGGPYTCIPLRFSTDDRLWVKETSWIAPVGWTDSPVNSMGPYGQEVAYAADDRSGYTKEAARDYQIKLRPSILMPRWASRLTLIVTDVRVERLQDISEADARAEGIVEHEATMTDPAEYTIGPESILFWCPVDAYRHLWNAINGPSAWDANPWVMAVSFDVVRGNIDQVQA